MTQQELKPCPFCGGTVNFHADDECDGCHYLHCSGCQGMFDLSASADPKNTSETLGELRSVIAKAWNRRAHPAEAEGVGVVAEAYSHRSRDSMQVTVMNIRQIGRLRDGDKLVRQVDHVATLSAVTAERDGEAESCEQWRALALQFDRHRMSALAHLKMVVAGQDGALDACRGFLSAPPVPGHAITEEIDQLRAEVEALRKDAERYRWLRGRLPGSAYRIAGVIYSEGGDGVDAAVDAAMAAKEA